MPSVQYNIWHRSVSEDVGPFFWPPTTLRHASAWGLGRSAVSDNLRPHAHGSCYLDILCLLLSLMLHLPQNCFPAFSKTGFWLSISLFPKSWHHATHAFLVYLASPIGVIICLNFSECHTLPGTCWLFPPLCPSKFDCLYPFPNKTATGNTIST